ncbi:MAG: DUF192 domain-containing protein [Natrialbaceae archaeon]|nr:DUF192 domain-containing protein [Natrialbaceae archaeon]
MQVHHDDGDKHRVLASDVDVADTVLSRMLGLMGRRALPEDYALAFRFPRARPRSVHMLFVFVPLDAIWVADGEVTTVTQLDPWIGMGRGRGDLSLELPSGAADAVAIGDRIWLE